MRRNSGNSDTHKIILLGNASVGKTSLMNRWLDDSFESSTRPTIGASNCFKSVIVDGKQTKVTLWDTAGQEQYRSIAPLYVRGAKVAIIVTSANDLDSFKAIPFWVELINSAKTNEIVSILAINKIDSIEMANSGLTDLIEENKANFHQFFYVSAKSGENVEILFNAAASAAAQIVHQAQNTNFFPEFVEPKTNNQCC